MVLTQVGRVASQEVEASNNARWILLFQMSDYVMNYVWFFITLILLSLLEYMIYAQGTHLQYNHTKVWNVLEDPLSINCWSSKTNWDLMIPLHFIIVVATIFWLLLNLYTNVSYYRISKLWEKLQITVHTCKEHSWIFQQQQIHDFTTYHSRTSSFIKSQNYWLKSQQFCYNDEWRWWNTHH